MPTAKHAPAKPYSPKCLELEFCELRLWGSRKLGLAGVLGSSQAKCSDKFAPRSRKVSKRPSSPLKFIADSLPPIIMRHEKARNTERRAKATKAADTWVEGTIASIPVAVDESMQL